MPRALMLLWLAWCAAQTRAYVPVWRSDITLWAHAAATAPWLPRAQINYGKALIASGQRERGVAIATRGYDLEVQRQNAKVAARAAAR